MVVLASWTHVNSAGSLSVAVSWRAAGGDGDGVFILCMHVCLLSCLPFAFGLSYQTAAVPESCPINIEE